MDKKICPILTQGLLANHKSSANPEDVKQALVYCLQDKCAMWTETHAGIMILNGCGLRSDK